MTLLKHADFEVPDFREFAAPPVAVPGYAQAVNALGPVAYWRLGELAGTTLSDQTGSHPMTLSSSGYTLGQTGALQTDNDTGVLFTTGKAATTGAVVPTSAGAAFSLLFWIRSPSTIVQDKYCIGQYIAGQPGHMLLTLRLDGRMRYGVDGDPLFNTVATISTNWRMLLFTRSTTGSAKWYVDGQLDSQATGHDAAILNTAFSIGKLTSLQPDVLFDEIAVFDKDLSLQDARWLYGLAVGALNLPPTL